MRNVVSPRFIACRLALAAPGPAIAGLAIAGLVAASLVALSSPARAETKIFFVENQPDGYGIDQCLASGAKCGKPMARAYCQSREYGEAVSYRKAEPEEMPKETGVACTAGNCV